MSAFLEGLILGMVAGPILVFGLERLSRVPIVERRLRRVRRGAANLYWRGIEKLLAHLDEMLARRREREADVLHSPNLTPPTGKGVVAYTSAPPPQ